MDISDYQKRAKETEQYAKDVALEHMPNLLVSKAVAVASFVRQHSQDFDSIAENLGDLLWYLSSIAAHCNLDLNAVAERNLEKVQERYGGKQDDPAHFDAGFPAEEQLPRQMTFRINETGADKLKGRVKLLVALAQGGEHQIGDTITDNAHADDGYRYHDAIHLAYMAVLRWSPVVRALLRRKRKSKPEIDEAEDGARAIDIEEGLTAAVFKLAKKNKYFRNVEHLPHEILTMAMALSNGLEVQKCSQKLWEKAILQGYTIFHQARENRGGYVDVDMTQRSISFRKLVSRRDLLSMMPRAPSRDV